MNPLFLTAPLIIGLIVFELIYTYIIGHKSIYKLKDFIASTFMGLGTLFITTFIKFASPAVIFYFIYESFNPHINGVAHNFLGYESFGWEWHIWLACLVLGDFSNYYS